MKTASIKFSLKARDEDVRQMTVFVTEDGDTSRRIATKLVGEQSKVSVELVEDLVRTAALFVLEMPVMGSAGYRAAAQLFDGTILQYEVRYVRYVRWDE